MFVLNYSCSFISNMISFVFEYHYMSFNSTGYNFIQYITRPSKRSPLLGELEGAVPPNVHINTIPICIRSSSAIICAI